MFLIGFLSMKKNQKEKETIKSSHWQLVVPLKEQKSYLDVFDPFIIDFSKWISAEGKI